MDKANSSVFHAEHSYEDVNAEGKLKVLSEGGVQIALLADSTLQPRHAFM